MLLIILIIVGLDQFTKVWALNNLKGRDSIVIIDDFLEFTYVENRGAAFGILQNSTLALTIVSFIVSLFIAYYLFKYKNVFTKSINLALILILSGAIGNLIDRWFRTYVIDFISVKFWGYYDFPVFNIADIAVTCGAILLMIIIIFTNKLDEIEGI